MVKSQQQHWQNIRMAKPKTLKNAQLVEFLELSGELLQNGYPLQNILTLAPALNLLSSDQSAAMAASFAEGNGLAQAMAPLVQQPNLITQLEIAEHHGNLAACCKENAQFLRERQEQTKQLRGLLAYPVFLLVMMAGLLVFIQLVLRPQLASLLPQQPMTNRPIIILIVVIIVALLPAVFWLKLPLERRRYCHLKLPIVNKIWRSYYNFLLFTDLAHLVQGGLSLQEILNYVSQFDPKSLQVFLARKVSLELKNGSPLSTIVSNEPLLPNELLILLAKGDTKAFQAIELQILAQRNFRQLNRRLKQLIDQTQPLLFILIAAMIAVLYLQILLPIYQIMRGF